MKKVLTVLLAAMLSVALAVPAFAASTTVDDIIAEMKAGIEVDGKVKEIPDKYIDLAESWHLMYILPKPSQCRRFPPP